MAPGLVWRSVRESWNFTEAGSGGKPAGRWSRVPVFAANRRRFVTGRMTDIQRNGFAMSSAARVLVIEDERPIRKFVRITLETHGYAVNETETAAAGFTRQPASRRTQ